MLTAEARVEHRGTQGVARLRRNDRRGLVCRAALAEKTVPVTAKPSYDALNFLGLVGFRDPPRAEVKAQSRAEGSRLRVIMVTGTTP